MDKHKILMFITDLHENGGVTNVILNHYNKLISNGFIIDFCAIYDRKSSAVDYVENNGSKYYVYPQNDGRPNEKGAKQFLNSLLCNEEYEAVHVHLTGKYALLPLIASKTHGIKHRIYHAHNPKEIYDIHTYLRWLRYEPLCILYSNVYLACSKMAGDSIFGKRNYYLVKNTIDVNKFKFNLADRVSVRRELGLKDDDVVIGNVSRLAKQKNPFFTVDIFTEIVNKNNNAYLVWVGDGPLRHVVEEKIQDSGIEKNVIFTGSRTDVNKVYSAFDVFILPSMYEGLGIVFIEAQANGLPVFTSTKVPQDTSISELIQFIDLDVPVFTWAERVVSRLSSPQTDLRTKYFSEVKNSGFDNNLNNDFVNVYKKIFAEGK